jgi:adenosine deaminase
MNKIVQKHTLGNNNLQGVSIVCKKKHTLCTHLEGSSKEKTMTSEAKQVASNLRTLAKKNDIVVKVEYKKASSIQEKERSMIRIYYEVTLLSGVKKYFRDEDWKRIKSKGLVFKSIKAYPVIEGKVA